MNRRKRKKRHFGEFREHGFILIGRYDPPLPPDRWDAIIDEVIAFAESRSLGITGNVCGPQVDVQVARMCRRGSCVQCNRRYGKDRPRGDVTDADRLAVLGWFEAHGCKAAVGPLFNVRHSSAARYEAATPKLEET